MKSDYETLSQATKGLQEAGYTYDFNLHESAITCSQTGDEFDCDSFKIDEVFRFEGASSVDDSSVVYAITSSSGLKGILVDAYGTYADSLSQEMIEKLRRF